MIDDAGAAAVEVRGDRTEVTALTGPAARSNHHIALKPHPDDDDTVTTQRRLASAQRRLEQAAGIDDVFALQRSHDDGDTGICNHQGTRPCTPTSCGTGRDLFLCTWLKAVPAPIRSGPSWRCRSAERGHRSRRRNSGPRIRLLRRCATADRAAPARRRPQLGRNHGLGIQSRCQPSSVDGGRTSDKTKGGPDMGNSWIRDEYGPEVAELADQYQANQLDPRRS